MIVKGGFVHVAFALIKRITIVGIMLIFQCFISLGNVEIVIIILSICIFSLILEIALKVI